MKLYAYESNQSFRNIRKKQFNLHSQQKTVFKDLFRHDPRPNFRDPHFYGTLVHGVPSEHRAQVWGSLISNSTEITPEFYLAQLNKLDLASEFLTKSKER